MCTNREGSEAIEKVVCIKVEETETKEDLIRSFRNPVSLAQAHVGWLSAEPYAKAGHKRGPYKNPPNLIRCFFGM